MRSERGFALVITLVVSALLVTVTVEFIHEVVVDTTLRQNYADAQQASLLAESGVNGGIEILKNVLANQKYSSLLDRWAQPLQIEDEKGSITVTIEDESGKLYLNAPMGSSDDFASKVFVRLLKELDLSLDLRDTLVDWTDNNTYPERAGAESPYYKALSPPYAAKDDKLDTVEELGLVKGFTPKVMEKLRPFVTVYPNSPNAPTATININTAPPELIKALDDQITDHLVAQLLEYRKATPFKTPGELGNVYGFKTIASNLSLNVEVKGVVYRIVAQGKVGETTRVIEAVVRVTGNSAAKLYWREY